MTSIPMQPARHAEERRRRSDKAATAVVFAAAWVIIVLVMLRADAFHPSSRDEMFHHLPAIHQIADQFPQVEWHRLPLATGFGYHVLLAGFVGLGAGDSLLRLINAVIVASAVLIIGAHARRVVDTLAPLFMLAIFVDAYFIGAARWIGSEGAYFLLTAAVLVATCRGETALAGRGGAGLACGFACLVRQTGLFLSLMIPTVDWLVDRRKPRQLVTLAMLVLAPSGAALALLYLAYGGLTAEGVYRSYNVKMSLTPLAFAPASGALFFAVIAALMPRVRQQLRGVPFLLGALIGLAVPSAPGAGREQSPIWFLARQAPIVSGRSIVVVVLAAVGVGCITALVRSLWELGEHRTGAMVAVAVLTLTAVHVPSGQLLGRYFEPVLLVIALLGLMRQPDRTWVTRVLLVLISAGAVQSLLLLGGALTVLG
jgi:hypothetical protein